MSVPPCLPKLPHDLDLDRSAAVEGLTHTIGSRTLPSGNIIEGDYKDNHNRTYDSGGVLSRRMRRRDRWSGDEYCCDKNTPRNH